MNYRLHVGRDGKGQHDSDHSTFTTHIQPQVHHLTRKAAHDNKDGKSSPQNIVFLTLLHIWDNLNINFLFSMTPAFEDKIENTCIQKEKIKITFLPLRNNKYLVTEE